MPFAASVISAFKVGYWLRAYSPGWYTLPEILTIFSTISKIEKNFITSRSFKGTILF